MSPELYYCRGQFGLIKMDLFVRVFGGLNWPLYWGQILVPFWILEWSEQPSGPLENNPFKKSRFSSSLAISEDDESFLCLLQAKNETKI